MRFRIPPPLLFIGYTWKRISAPIKWIVFFCLVVLVNYECYIITIPKTYYFLSGLNKILVQLIYAFLTGFIFYFIIDRLPLEKKRASVNRLLHNSVYQIVTLTKHLLNEICTASGTITEGRQIRCDEFLSVCEGVSFQAANFRTYYHGPVSAKDFVRYYCDQMTLNLDQIVAYFDILDDDWTYVTSGIIDNVNQIQFHLNIRFKNPSFNAISLFVWNTYGLSRDLFELDKSLSGTKQNRVYNRDKYSKSNDCEFQVEVKKRY